MNNLLSTILLLPIIIWSVFQPALYANAMLIEQAISSTIYETSKEASLQGRYDNKIYDEMKDRLVEVHNFDPDKVEIKGTETLTPRGERMYIEVIIPKPKTTVLEVFGFGKSEPYHYKKYIMSEYVQ